MHLLALLLSLHLNAAEDEGWRLGDLGVTVHLPAGWQPKRGGWADWELTASSSKGLGQLKVWATPFQVEITPEAAQAWGGMYAEQMEKASISKVGVVGATVEEIGGRPTAVVKLTGSSSAGAITGWFMAFATSGKVVHSRVISTTRRSTRAATALRKTVEAMAVDKPPKPPQKAVSSTAGFAATLPDGWRAPISKEYETVREVSAQLGEENLSPDECWAAIRPPAVGDPDVIFTCSTYYHVGPLDEHSFKGVEAEVHERWFGNSDVPPAERVTVGDRTGLYYRLTAGSGKPTRLLMAPYTGGMMTAWGMGGVSDEATMDAAMLALAPTVTFSGEGGGAPIIGADKWIAYYLSYRPFSLVVIGPVLGLLGLVGGGVMLARRRPSYDEDED